MQPLVDAGRTVEWRVVRSGGGGELRIELAEAATPSRSLGLRITGHRRGVPLGGEFATAAMAMVRLDGESADSALVDYRVGPEAVIEIAGRIRSVGRGLNNRLTVSDTTAENLHHTFPFAAVDDDSLDYALFRVEMPRPILK